MRFRRSLALQGFALVAAIGPAIGLALVWSYKVYFPGWFHFAGVGLAAAVATAAAVALTVAGAIIGDARAVVAGLAFSMMAALLCLHGVATPGFIVERNGVVAFTGAATLPIGCGILALGSLSTFRHRSAVRPLIGTLIVGSALVILLGASAIIRPGLVPSVPEAGGPVALIVLGFGVAACLLLELRAFRTYRLTQRYADLCVVIGIAWLATALASALLTSYWELVWWIGHGLEIVGIGLVGIPVARDLRLGAAQQSRPLVGDLRGSDLVASAEAFLGSHVRALLVALAEKDTSTEEHTRRVALLSARVGDELCLPPGRLRNLAMGGLLHDIGKLSVDDDVLKKPSALTDAEFEEVKAHPEAGVRLLRELGGFSEAVLSLVNDHHERLDGSGYPRGLRAEEISLDARILATCDVYDALVSPRVYRDAWSPERAMKLLRDGADVEFDRKVVDALALVLGAPSTRVATAATSVPITAGRAPSPTPAPG
jgi:HD-GYP domain-containing protein (c-di-GMP phosphodiesterase class II)